MYFFWGLRGDGSQGTSASLLLLAHYYGPRIELDDCVVRATAVAPKGIIFSHSSHSLSTCGLSIHMLYMYNLTESDNRISEKPFEKWHARYCCGAACLNSSLQHCQHALTETYVGHPDKTKPNFSK